MRIIAPILAFSVFAAPPALAGGRSLNDLAFLAGAWRGGEEFIFEETWSPAAAGVMTGMARGYQGGELRVLEYIVIAEEAAGLVMRFKHYNSDY